MATTTTHPLVVRSQPKYYIRPTTPHFLIPYIPDHSPTQRPHTTGLSQTIDHSKPQIHSHHHCFQSTISTIQAELSSRQTNQNTHYEYTSKTSMGLTKMVGQNGNQQPNALRSSRSISSAAPKPTLHGRNRLVNMPNIS
jgi:hypothetical protein